MIMKTTKVTRKEKKTWNWNCLIIGCPGTQWTFEFKSCNLCFPETLWAFGIFPELDFLLGTDQMVRSNCPRVFCGKGVLRNFAKFIGKHLWQSVFFNKVPGAACKRLPGKTLAQVNFVKFLRTPFFKGHLRWLLL